MSRFFCVAFDCWLLESNGDDETSMVGSTAIA